ncbi:MAG: NAD(P)H-dependent oxidoreductase [Flavobacteriales bacterium]|nr:NAD(P)H-dependent oxidoreductase [Flavobacteriales bacterium]
MNIIDKLNWRYAVKQFDVEKKLSEEQISTLVRAANLTATSFGLQPSKIVIVENKELREELVQYSWGQRQVADASHLLVITINSEAGDNEVDEYVKRTADLRSIPEENLEGMSKMVKGFLKGMDDNQKHAWMANQAHIVLGNLLTICAVEGIDACPIAGFQPEKYDEILDLKMDGQKSVLVLPVGFRLDSDKYASLAKVRMADSDYVIMK